MKTKRHPQQKLTAKAATWLRRAAKQGDAWSQFMLRSLAEQGHAEAQYNLGVMYDYGEGVPEDDAEAMKWFRLAAEQGHQHAIWRR